MHNVKSKLLTRTAMKHFGLSGQDIFIILPEFSRKKSKIQSRNEVKTLVLFPMSQIAFR